MSQGMPRSQCRRSILLAFPWSNENVRADARALQRAGMLSLFCTTIAWRRSQALIGWLPSWLRAEFGRRVFEGIDPRLIRTFPGAEIARQIGRRIGLSALTRHETGWASADGVSRDFDERVARLVSKRRVRADAVYAYEYAALRTFKAAADAGMRRFYELPIGYWRAGLRIMTEERERKPEWASTIELLRDSAEKNARKDEEISTADHIIVPSRFVQKTLIEHPAMRATVDVVPYGAPTAVPIGPRSHGGKLRLLYVGHLSQRKGISYLFDAMNGLRDVATLTLVGPRPSGACPPLDIELQHHEWLGTVPHERVLELMSRHDLFIFPSLFEGFALVILEAMAQGLPVVATANSGADMAIEHGVNGFIVPIRDADAIARHVIEFFNDRERLAAMSAAAARRAADMSWAAREALFIETLRMRLATSVG